MPVGELLKEVHGALPPGERRSHPLRVHRESRSRAVRAGEFWTGWQALEYRDGRRGCFLGTRDVARAPSPGRERAEPKSFTAGRSNAPMALQRRFQRRDRLRLLIGQVALEGESFEEIGPRRRGRRPGEAEGAAKLRRGLPVRAHIRGVGGGRGGELENRIRVSRRVGMMGEASEVARAGGRSAQGIKHQAVERDPPPRVHRIVDDEPCELMSERHCL